MEKAANKRVIKSDILILGGGCSGWSLVSSFIKHNLHLHYSITIVEKALGNNHKTWSFWEQLSDSTIWSADYTWDKLRLTIDDEYSATIEEDAIYKSIKARSFVESIKGIAVETSSIQLVEDEILRCNHSNMSATGVTNDYTAKIVFQNFFNDQNQLTDYTSKLEYNLSQHFKGLVIESEKLELVSNEVIFMDFTVNQQYGFAFMYVLPYSTSKALFEYTLFSEKLLQVEQYEQEIQHYLKNKYGIANSEYTILEEEFGVIPMNDMLPSTHFSTNWFKMGSIAGMTKASTGYTFSRIQQAAEAVAAVIASSGIQDEMGITAALQKGISPRRYRLYDIILLELLKNSPNEVIDAFKMLFAKLGIKRMLQFLSENQSLLSDFAVLTGVDTWTFLKATWKSRKVLLKHLFN